VPLVLTSPLFTLDETGGLSDLAPTILGMLDVEIPGDMTGVPLATRP
jgi:bisphosphoglycerate-independent phosphoglycerate mutase (AlkP superfamily)